MRVILLAGLTLTIINASAQQNRLLFHYSRNYEAIYNINDIISFRLKGSEEKITGEITDITDSTIVFSDRAIEPHKIGVIYVDQKTKIFFPFRYKYKFILIAGGIGYFLIDSINNKEIDRTTVIISTSAVVTGVVAGFLIKDYIKLKPGRKLVILR
ncbi:MAG: hypothetical protein WDO14_21250 [Bacteroidota bacterium]